MFDTISKGFKAARNQLKGITELTEENIAPALREVRLSLLEADVELGVTKKFLDRLKEKSLGQTFQSTLTAGQKGDNKISRKFSAEERFIQVAQEELEAMMKSDAAPIIFGEKNLPTTIMMVGLQGSGKTTTSGKLAKLLEQQGKKVLLVAADVARPAAIEQLKVLGTQVGVPVFSIPGGRPYDICEQALEEAKKLKRDTIIFDTAGRLAVDEALMEELMSIHTRVKPLNTLLVVDAMIGQDAVKTAAAFHARVNLDGIVLTKLDGDARGGAALSIREVTGAPVKFVGMGEGMDKLEAMRADGLASRILGFGDLVGLMKDFEGKVDAEKAEADAKKMLQGQFTFDDFLEQLRMIKSMGPLQDMMEKLPFFADSMPEGFSFDDKELSRTEAIIFSMTPKERAEPELLLKESKRLSRIARGSGRAEKDVQELIQRFMMMRQMMGGLGKQAGMLSKIPGMKQLAQAKKLKDAFSGKGLGFGPGGLSDLLGGGNPLGGMPGGGIPGGFPGGMPGMDNPMFQNMAGELFQSLIAEGGGPGGTRPSLSDDLKKKMSDREKDKKKKERKAQKEARKKSRR